MTAEEPNKNILDLVGDDGELLYPIDAAGEFIFDEAVDSNLFFEDEFHGVRIPFLSNIWATMHWRYDQIRRILGTNMAIMTWVAAILVFAYLANLALLSRNKIIVSNADATSTVSIQNTAEPEKTSTISIQNTVEPEETSIVLQNNIPNQFVTLAGIVHDASEKRLLTFYPTTNFNYKCEATVLYNTIQIPVYRVTAGSLEEMDMLSVQNKTIWQILPIDGTTEWYQLRSFYRQSGMGIVLAKDFTRIMCSQNVVSTPEHIYARFRWR